MNETKLRLKALENVIEAKERLRKGDIYGAVALLLMSINQMIEADDTHLDEQHPYKES